MKQRINIMTSCDDNYARYVFVNLANINLVLGNRYDVHFYLLQRDISAEHNKMLKEYVNGLSINFHNIQVTNVDWMSKFTSHAKYKDYERFFDAICHLLLPNDIDRVMYIDTGDFLFTSDEQPFYFEDFNNKSLLVSRFSVKVRSMTDRYDFDFFSKDIWGTINSGQVLFNLKRLRELNYQPQDYIDYIENWAKAKPKYFPLFAGDQAFLSAFYAGDIHTIEQRNPNNAKLSKKPESAINDIFLSIHFNQMFDAKIKPWHIPFNKASDLNKYCVGYGEKSNDFLKQHSILNPVEVRYLLQWWEYCKLTPYYENIKNESLTNPLFYERLMAKYVSNLNSFQTEVDNKNLKSESKEVGNLPNIVKIIKIDNTSSN